MEADELSGHRTNENVKQVASSIRKSWNSIKTLLRSEKDLRWILQIDIQIRSVCIKLGTSAANKRINRRFWNCSPMDFCGPDGACFVVSNVCKLCNTTLLTDVSFPRKAIMSDIRFITQADWFFFFTPNAWHRRSHSLHHLVLPSPVWRCCRSLGLWLRY